MSEELSAPTNIRVTIGDGIPIGHVAVIIFNCPIMEIETDGQLGPAFKLHAREAMEVGMNLIHLAKVAEQRASMPEIALSEGERCGAETRLGPCILVQGHTGTHGVMDPG